MTTHGQDSFTLSLCVQSAQNLPTQAKAAFCTMLMWSNSSSGGPGKSTTQPKCTALQEIRYNQPVEWNEELQMDVTDPATEVLTVRVKDHGDSLVASCNIYLAHLRPGQALDQWFQLHPAGYIHMKLMLAQNQPSHPPIPTPVGSSPYAPDFQALLDLQMKKIATMTAAMTNAPQQPTNNVGAILAIQNKAQENARLMVNMHMQQHQQSFNTLLQSQLQAQTQNAAQNAAPSQQSTGPNFHEMMGTAANASTFAANLQQLNGGGNAGTGAMGTVASIGLGALGLGPFGAFFGA